MRRRLWLPAVLLLFSAALSGRAAVQSPEEIFQRGLHEEEVRGDLEAAIRVYQSILDHHSANRTLAARAQLRIGLCYEKLGPEKARFAFRKVVEEYSDQDEVVRVARERLAALDPNSRAAKMKRIWSGADALDVEAALSPDDSKIAFTDWNTGNLAIKDLATGQVEALTDIGWFRQPGYEFVTGQAWSPDGRRIVYGRFGSGNLTYDLHVIVAETKQNRAFYTDPEIDLFPMDWSHDASHVLALVQRSDKRYELARIALESGKRSTLLLLNWKRPISAVFSPDDAWIAFDFEADRDHSDIYLISSSGGEAVRITDSPADDLNPRWSPDGSHLVFRSQRRGDWDLWGIGMEAGRPLDDPFLVKSDVRGVLASWSRSGKLLIGEVRSTSEIYSLPVDPETGRSTGGARRLTWRWVGTNGYPAFSPDGQALAYVSNRPEGAVLCVHPLDGGREREYELDLRFVRAPQWSPQGTQIAVSGTDPKDRTVTYRVDLESGHSELVVSGRNNREWSPVRDWSPDGRVLLFSRPAIDAEDFFTVDVESGRVGRIDVMAPAPFMDGQGFGYQRYSPDGSQIAFIRTTSSPEGLRRGLWLVPAAGGRAHEVVAYGPGQKGRRECDPHFIEWSPRGDRIATLCNESRTTPSRFLIVTLEGEVTQLETGLPNRPQHPPSWSPDGTQVALTSGASTGEFWILENFLRQGGR